MGRFQGYSRRFFLHQILACSSSLSLLMQCYKYSRIVPFKSTNELLKSIFAFVLIVVYLKSAATWNDKVFMIF